MCLHVYLIFKQPVSVITGLFIYFPFSQTTFDSGTAHSVLLVLLGGITDTSMKRNSICSVREEWHSVCEAELYQYLGHPFLLELIYSVSTNGSCVPAVACAGDAGGIDPEYTAINQFQVKGISFFKAVLLFLWLLCYGPPWETLWFTCLGNVTTCHLMLN